MAVDTKQIASDAKQQAHELIEQLGPSQLATIVQRLEVMIDDDALTEEDCLAIHSSRVYFRENTNGGLSFDDMVAGCGLPPIRFVRPTETPFTAYSSKKGRTGWRSTALRPPGRLPLMPLRQTL